MMIARIKDLISNKNYNIYLTLKNKKLNYKVKCIDNQKIYYLNQNETKRLFSTIFNYEKKYFGKYGEYDVYIDEANNKHYLKNNFENFKLFFRNNGNNALLFKKENNERLNNYPKNFMLQNNKENIKILLTCTLLFFYSMYLGGFLAENKKSNNVTYGEYVTSDLITAYNYINNIETSEIVEKIHESSGISEEEKKYLINENLFDDILNIVDKSRNEDLRERIVNITKVYFNEEELNDVEKTNWAGYYSSLEPNKLHVRNAEQSNDVISHEFVHLLQDNNQYHFIREAVAEIITEEYYGEKPNAYLEEIKYVKILMEIIGPQPIFDCCFKGNTNSFEEAIRNKLNLDDATELLSLFTIQPLECENIHIMYQKINNLLSKMYNGNIMDDELISTIEEHPEYVNRGYFNINYIDECEKKDSYIYETFKVDEATKQGLIDIKCSAITTEKITVDEFLKLGGDPRNISYASLPNFHYIEGGYIINSDTSQKYSLKDAISKGYIYNTEFMKTSIINNISLEEAIEYESRNNYKAHIKIVDADSSTIKRVERIYFRYIKGEGQQPFVKLIIKKKINRIDEKFPEQFQNRATRISFCNYF